MAIPDDKWTILLNEYYDKFEDYVPRYIIHRIDAEELIRETIKSGKKFATTPPGNLITDDM